MNKPNLQVHFDPSHPDQPGLYLSRHSNGFITVMEVTAKDIEQDKRETTWLDGSWGPRLTLVDAPVQQLDQKAVLAWVEGQIKALHEVGMTDASAPLRRFRDHFFSGFIAQSVEQESLKLPVAGSIPAGPATAADPGLVREFRDMATMVRDKGFESLEEFNRLVASADLTTPERFDAFTKWKMNDGTREGLVKLASR
jgi:hypothetical protein